MLDGPLYPPGAQPPRPQAHKHGANQFPKGGGVHRVHLVLLAVPKVVVVQGAPGEADALGGFVIIQQPLELEKQTHVSGCRSPPNAKMLRWTRSEKNMLSLHLTR